MHTEKLLPCPAGRKVYSRALELLLQALTAPTLVANAITVNCFKKYVLVSLIHSGECLKHGSSSCSSSRGWGCRSAAGGVVSGQCHRVCRWVSGVAKVRSVWFAFGTFLNQAMACKVGGHGCSLGRVDMWIWQQ